LRERDRQMRKLMSNRRSGVSARAA
jgi:hypothetical protein